jgi:hypothetical protein
VGVAVFVGVLVGVGVALAVGNRVGVGSWVGGGKTVKAGVVATMAVGVGDEGGFWEGQITALLTTATRVDTVINNRIFRAIGPAGGAGVEGG